MNIKVAAGLLMYRHNDNKVEVFLVHPGGPMWKNKDFGVWSIPKGLVDEGEDLLETAKREFREETGMTIPPAGGMTELGFITYPTGKKVYAWGFEDGTFDPKSASWRIESNLTPQGWPEADRGEYFSIEVALKRILPSQKGLITTLKEQLEIRG